MAFTYPASLAGIPATQASVKASFDNNYDGGQPGQLRNDTYKPTKKSDIAAYITKETTED